MIYVKVQFRIVRSDVNVSAWKDWDELGTFHLESDAIAALETLMGTLRDVSFDQIGIYMGDGWSSVQLRLKPTDVYPTAIKDENWTIGLKDILENQ